MKLAIFGATGNVGREIIRLLEESAHEAFHADPVLIASAVSAGEEIPFGQASLSVSTFDEADLSKVDVAIFATPKEVSAQYIPEVLAKGKKVIDLSSAYRSDEAVPMVVDSVNGALVDANAEHVSIADVATIGLASVLNAVMSKVEIKRVMTTLLYPTSHKGTAAMDELFRQSAALLGGAGLEVEEGEEFKHQVAFNVIPQVGDFTGKNTDAETGLLLEVNRVLEKPVPVVSTALYVPTFVGMSQSITIDMAGVLNAQEISTVLDDAQGISVIDVPENLEYTTPYGTAETTNVFVSRIREDALSSGTVQMFVSCDNLRTGAALEVIKRLERMLG